MMQPNKRSESDLTLVVETTDGTIVHRVSPARPLPRASDPGPAAENMTRSAAAAFGLPDFVFRPKVHTAPGRNRELGDSIIAVGDVAAVVQVKARTATNVSDERERAWLDSRIEKAARQALGTVNEVKRSKTTLTNERGIEVPFDGNHYKWVYAIVLDHPRPPGEYVPAETPGCVVLLRRDWEFLFEQLRSTDAVIRYLMRVSEERPVVLGTEPSRYYQLALADAEADPTPADPRLQRAGFRDFSTPALPLLSPSEDDWRQHLLIRAVLEDVSRTSHLNGIDPARSLEVLAAIDALPVGYRTELGELLMGWLKEVADDRRDGIVWRLRRIESADRPHLIFAAANKFDDAVQGAFGMLVALRHRQFGEVLGDASGLSTVGILLTPRSGDRRPWDTTMAAVHGSLDFDPEYWAAAEELWPVRLATAS